MERIWRDVKERGDCLSLKELELDGKDLIRDGMKPGPALGELLQELLNDVLEHPEHNEREYLLARSRTLRAEK